VAATPGRDPAATPGNQCFVDTITGRSGEVNIENARVIEYVSDTDNFFTGTCSRSR
jgi:hypothetical protein